MRKIALLSVSAIGCAFFLSFLNTGFLYREWKTIEAETLTHPEFLPDATTATLISAGNTTTFADSYWIAMIQYISDVSATQESEKYTLALAELITDLHPRFPAPYEISLLLMPEKKNISEEEWKKYIALGEKGIANTCDREKLDAISKITDLGTLWNNESLKNPCLDGMIPYLLAYHEFYDNHAYEEAKKDYTIASMNEDTPRAVRVLIPLMDGKGGSHRSSAITFLTIAENAGDTNDICHQYAEKILSENALSSDISADLLVNLEEMREEIQTEEKENSQGIISCSDYFDRAMKQIHMEFLDEAEVKFFDHFGVYATGAEALLDAGIIGIIPRVPGDKNDELLYGYDPEQKNWDVMTPIAQEKLLEKNPLETD